MKGSLMNIKISFHHMPHSDALENHAREKLVKLKTLFKRSDDQSPLNVDLSLHAHPNHAHHEAELHVRGNGHDFSAKDEGPDLYAIVDIIIDRVVSQAKKEKERSGDKKHRVENEKTLFSR
jgi:putative sigma-54 modulation protein